MPAITTNDLKNGMTLDLDDGLFQVVEFQHVKPGKGGAFVRTTLKNVRTGAVVDRTFRAGEQVEQAIVDKREMQFLYRDGDDYVFMDNTTYDQLNVAPTPLGEAAELPGRGRRRRSCRCTATRSSASSCPPSVELTITETEPGRPGRPGLGRPQAGHARDRPRRPGAAVRRTRRPDQGRHPHRRVHHPGLSPSRPTADREPSRRRASAAGAEARERALALLYEAETKRSPPGAEVLGRAGRSAPTRSPVRAGRGACGEHARRDRRADRAPTPRAGPSSACRPSTAALLRMASSSWRTAPTCPPAVVIDEAVELAKRVLHRRLGPLRQRRALGHRRGRASLSLRHAGHLASGLRRGARFRGRAAWGW